MKRKTLPFNLPETIGKQRSVSQRVSQPPFFGYVCATILQGDFSPVFTANEERKCLFAPGYRVVSFLPDQAHWCVTAVYDENDRDVEWYVDITLENFTRGDSSFLDLYLDIRCLPDQTCIMLDEDELALALENGEINREIYEKAYLFRQAFMDEWVKQNFAALSAFLRKTERELETILKNNKK